MKHQRLLFTALFAAALLAATPVIAATSPDNGPHDSRVKTLLYQDNQVYKLDTQFGFSTTIEFGEKEHIETISLGDSKSWDVIKPARPNILFIKPLAENSGTNMTVLTNKRIYSFMLFAARPDEKDPANATFRVSFKYPDIKEASFSSRAQAPAAYDPLEGREKSTWNFEYDYAGARSLKPAKIFDDGTFTYFRFDKGQPLPAIFAVDPDGTERLVNHTVKGAYLIVTSVERQFTLRDGDTATCIFNQARAGLGGTETSIVPVAPLKESNRAAASVPLPSRKPSKSLFTMLFAGFKGAEQTSFNN